MSQSVYWFFSSSVYSSASLFLFFVLSLSLSLSLFSLSLIGLVSSVFANGLGDLVSVPGYVIQKTLKMVLDISLLNTQQYKVLIKGKVEKVIQGKE